MNKWPHFALLLLFQLFHQAFALPLDKITLPKGFHINIYSNQVPGAREMALGKNGIVYVGTRGTGKVYALLPNTGSTGADKVFTIASNLNNPNGVAYRHGDLYVAEINRVIKFPNINQHLARPPKPIVVNDSFPDKWHHGWKYIKFGPDGKLYVPVGAPCNVCISNDPRFATIMRMNYDGTDLEIFAQGVRNTVGFDWDPLTKKFWFTDNGRDWLGDDLPPDELNFAPTAGLNFGFPYVYGKNVPDPKFGHLAKHLRFVPPVQELGPHVAALGMIFYTGKMFPTQFRNQIFIAEHGSWNRSRKIGYRITLVRRNGNKAISYEPFATGWLQGQRVWGRPVALLQLPDGSMLVSDDKAGAIYRISYQSGG